MAANEYNIAAGIVPIDGSSGGVANNYYIAAGLVPTDSATALTASLADDINAPSYLTVVQEG